MHKQTIASHGVLEVRKRSGYIFFQHCQAIAREREREREQVFRLSENIKLWLLVCPPPFFLACAGVHRNLLQQLLGAHGQGKQARAPVPLPSFVAPRGDLAGLGSSLLSWIRLGDCSNWIGVHLGVNRLCPLSSRCRALCSDDIVWPT